MAVADCRTCGKVVNTEWAVCPECGVDPRSEPMLAAPTGDGPGDGTSAATVSEASRAAKGNLGSQALWIAIGGVVLQFLPILNWVGLGLLVWGIVTAIRCLGVEDRASQSRGQAWAGLAIAGIMLAWWALATIGSLAGA